MKTSEVADECGLVAEFLKFVAFEFFVALGGTMNEILQSGFVPPMRKTLFQKLPRITAARNSCRFPIANIRLLYKTCGQLIFGRIEMKGHSSNTNPKDNMVFEATAGIQQQLFGPNIFIDKTLLAATPLWFVNLD